MGERYQRLFKLPENLYAEGAPLIIAAGVLLKDTQTGNVLAQLKFQSIAEKTIQAVSVKLSAYDTAGNLLGEEITHSYLDFRERRDRQFGQREAIILPDNTTRIFTVAVTEVVFSDRSVWKGNAEKWEPLPAQQDLETALQDAQLAEQYRIHYGRDCKYIYHTEKDLWQCPCGAWNHKEESVCHWCGKNANELAAFQTAVLKAELEERLRKEAEEAEIAAQKAAETKAKLAAEAKIRKQKIQKQLMIAVPVLLVVIVAGSLSFGVIRRGMTYEKSMDAFENGNYQAAMDGFKSLGDYKDSSDRYAEAEQKQYPAKMVIENILKNGTKENINLSVSDEKFSGYALDISNAEKMIRIGSGDEIIFADPSDYRTIYYQNLIPTGSGNMDFEVALQSEYKNSKLHFYYEVDDVITLDDNIKAGIAFSGTLDMNAHERNQMIDIDDVRLQSDRLTEEELERYPITQEMKDSYITVLSQFEIVYLYNFGTYLKDNLQISLSDLGFSDYLSQIPTLTANELSEKYLN